MLKIFSDYIKFTYKVGWYDLTYRRNIVCHLPEKKGKKKLEDNICLTWKF